MKRLKPYFYRLRDELGAAGVAGIFVFALAAAFVFVVLQPLKEESRELQARAGTVTPQAQSPSRAAEKLDEVYGYLAKPEETTDWLAKLYAIGQATGVELQSASYKTREAGGRLERYEIVLPLTGSYVQMRDFLKRSLAEIPVLSLDQISLKREGRREGSVQAELRFTLHMVKPS